MRRRQHRIVIYIYEKNASFYQDRLGTHIGGTQKKSGVSLGVCEWQDDIGLLGGDLVRSEVMQSREDCARACVAWTDASRGRSCGAADWNGERCFLKEKFAPFPREGGHACVVRQ